ncbi:MAG: anthranilate synthase/aminodeoxychorismate synthase-like glutamine amidotransferase [Candidatus Poriferisodalaceae bacterium]|jgi:anthranilate synthase/aminodeoxychorismate synthase-like glutamine amidotransferase
MLVIDNYDSFVYILVQYLQELGVELAVHRNDEVSIEDVDAMLAGFDGILISPGPGRPAAAGVSPEVVRRYSGQIPILGVCLGHQCIGEIFGGEVVPAPTVMHGKTSQVTHGGRGVFAGVPSPMTVTRYHSLVIAPESVPDVLEVTATTEDGVIMGLQHREHQLYGVQFHPESILSEHGHALLANFVALLGAGDSAGLGLDAHR